MSINPESLATVYTEDGFVFPLDVISEQAATTIREDLEAAENELAGQQEKLGLLRAYPDRLLPSFDNLTRHPVLIAAVSQILGPNLLVWSAALFDKSANTENIVTWHQDLTYWGLDDAEEVTAWVALSPSTVESGCMQFVPGSHKQNLVPHVDTFNEKNLLTRGQKIAVEVNASDGVAVVLKAGQASLHHGHLFHSSGPNTTDYRRVGSAIRYIKTSMKQRSGDRLLVAHVSGEDQFNHFTISDPPAARLSEKDFAHCRKDAELKRRQLYEGVEDRQGKRY